MEKTIDPSVFAQRLDAIVEQTLTLVRAESPSDDLDAVAACADAIDSLGYAVLGKHPETVDDGGRRHLLWRWGESPRVLLLGHFDTVWPVGTIASMPAETRDGALVGPGSFDMKASIVMAFHALDALRSPDGVAMLLTSDEEIGSASGQPLLEELARGVDAVLVLEPSAPGGALKTGRKGVTSFRVSLSGRAAHSGLEPEKGINAVLEAGHEILATAALARAEIATTVAPTIVHGGTAINVVPDAASVEIDVRAESEAELRRVRDAIVARSSVTDVARSVEQLSWRPPLETRWAEELFARAERVARALDRPPVSGVTVGGGSDGNLTAALGIPTLDGLGAVGDGAHAPHEQVDIASLPERCALLAGLVDDLLHEPLRAHE